MSKLTPDPDELARALAAIEHRGQVNAALSDAVAESGMARVWDLGSVARGALREAARLAQLEAELAAQLPGAAPRLRFIADITAVCLAELVAHAAATMTAGARDPLGQPEADQ